MLLDNSCSDKKSKTYLKKPLTTNSVSTRGKVEDHYDLNTESVQKTNHLRSEVTKLMKSTKTIQTKSKKEKTPLNVDRGESEIRRDAEPRRRRKLFSRGQYDVDRVHAPVHDESIHGPSQVQQHFKDECDINTIMARYSQTGHISHFQKSPGEYAEHDGTTFTEAMFIIKNGQRSFDELPSHIRSHFDNDPAKFLDAAHDDSRHQEFVDLGWISGPQEDLGPIEVTVVNSGENAAQGAPEGA